MDSSVRAFLESNHFAVMITLKEDGTPHAVMVLVGLVDGRLWSSGTQTRVRTGHLRSDDRATLFVLSGDMWRWLTLETRVNILDGPDAPDQNLALYQVITGKPPDDVDEYMQAMVAEQRLIFEFEILRAYGSYPEATH